MLQKMEENTTFLEQDKNYLIAQAKMQRAMIYFSRARLFGKLMIVDRVLDPEEKKWNCHERKRSRIPTILS